ncbi:hypothetical protein [Leeuwenhoekiella blandensis]|uniref:Uncharacterized protein n=1 Tax=Leeuwenhoekiella blandensis (strain CECT 7118 / CCUG 51940 / KCTC 22103 / MED217) TaxID=398720 RepID=A3XQE4_LEEBM|nr:hypothetical protein [Leeuwenhoekiella blandensis]EAQ48230.1 hypothetical protein MED217_00490 [Leeuwenhoekiella blandensis MED217]
MCQIELKYLQYLVNICSCEFEFIYHFTQNVKECYPKASEQEVKSISLILMGLLLEKKFLQVYDFYSQEPLGSTTEDSLETIDNLWFEGASYIDFISLVNFTLQEWFVNLLKEKGYNFQDNWLEYISEHLWLQDLLRISQSDIQKVEAML